MKKLKIQNKFYEGLLKFGEYEHMKAFYEKGHLYFNTFLYFKQLEEKGDGRADKNEYATAHYGGPAKYNISFNISDSPDMTNAKIMNGGIDFGAITIDTGKNKEFTHLYSMSSIDMEWAKENDIIIDERNFAENKDYVVMIYNVSEFIKRLDEQFNELKIFGGYKHIEYINKNYYDGEIGPFRKFDNYSYQNEFRIIVNFGSLKPESIYLGSLSDIAWEPCNKKDFYSKNFQIGKIENGKNKIIQISNKNILDRL